MGLLGMVSLAPTAMVKLGSAPLGCKVNVSTVMVTEPALSVADVGVIAEL
ncbi:hypothetical protein GCM10011496_38410 [Polaromonas eurypsychrophila]|uniref:Uncharacterized protein n=1 Tax=Polaromonas eurypsychrophila TaxID=1614635 RepID=A0A916SRC7_9BURK|nr:hypothetical protein GCM10011496_38410 [Polaromonas eurypsychrophila]